MVGWGESYKAKCKRTVKVTTLTAQDKLINAESHVSKPDLQFPLLNSPRKRRPR